MEMGYLTVLHVRLGAKIGDLHAKDSNAFCKRQIVESPTKIWDQVSTVPKGRLIIAEGSSSFTKMFRWLKW